MKCYVDGCTNEALAETKWVSFGQLHYSCQEHLPNIRRARSCLAPRCEHPTVDGSSFCEVHQEPRGEQEPSDEDLATDRLERRIKELEAQLAGEQMRSAALKTEVDSARSRESDMLKAQQELAAASNKSLAHAESLNFQLEALKLEHKKYLACILAQGAVLGTLVPR